MHTGSILRVTAVFPLQKLCCRFVGNIRSLSNIALGGLGVLKLRM